MEIVDYANKYDENIKDLFVELQEYIASIDKEHYNIITDKYREKYFEKTMEEVKKYEGKIFLAKEQEKIIGIIVGIINNEYIKTYDFTAPKRGRITEFVVSKDSRTKGIGKLLLKKMEIYLKEKECKGILIDVFGYNENAQKFYYKNGYFNRNIEIMKKI